MKKKLFAATVIAATLIGATAAFAFAPQTKVEGVIQRVDPVGNTVTLADGTTLAVAPQLSIEPLQPGEFVTLMYQPGTDGRKELVAFWIEKGVHGES
jgi:hypothetical protein